jgi:DNA-binding MarR family transcriptional regulator
VSVAGAARPRTRADALAELGDAFKGTMAAVRRLRGRDTHRPGELSFAQVHLLGGLAERGALSAGELAISADLSAATVTQMLDGLAARGLVERVRSDRDRRVVTCTLTEQGRELIAFKRKLLEERWQAALQTFTTAELATAAAVIGQLRSFFDALCALESIGEPVESKEPLRAAGGGAR